MAEVCGGYFRKGLSSYTISINVTITVPVMFNVWKCGIVKMSIFQREVIPLIRVIWEMFMLISSLGTFRSAINLKEACDFECQVCVQTHYRCALIGMVI